jgi:hypothetical protein
MASNRDWWSGPTGDLQRLANKTGLELWASWSVGSWIAYDREPRYSPRHGFWVPLGPMEVVLSWPHPCPDSSKSLIHATPQ